MKGREASSLQARGPFWHGQLEEALDLQESSPLFILTWDHLGKEAYICLVGCVLCLTFPGFPKV